MVASSSVVEHSSGKPRGRGFDSHLCQYLPVFFFLFFLSFSNAKHASHGLFYMATPTRIEGESACASALCPGQGEKHYKPSDLVTAFSQRH